jgi:hypothetical protein
MGIRALFPAAAFVVLAALPPAARAQSSVSDLRVTLNTVLAAHAQLAAAATGAALRGQTVEFQAAAAALDQNSVSLAKAIGGVYGADAESAFLTLWRQHIGFFVDYTTAVAKKDLKGQDQAVKNLVNYATAFAAFLNRANPNLPVPVVTDLVQHHVVSLKAVVDAQAKGDWTGAFTRQREAVAHMRMIADPLAAAIGKQFPEKFAAR